MKMLKEIRRAVLWLPVLAGPDWLADWLCSNKTYAKWLDPRGWLGLA